MISVIPPPRLPASATSEEQGGGRALEQPISPHSEPPFAAWNESKLRRKHTAAFHGQLRCFSARSPRPSPVTTPPEVWVSR
jgi:hypothetical protein